MAYSDIKEMLKDARNFATGANDFQTVNILKDIQLEVYDLLDENRNLRNEIQELKSIQVLEEEMKYRQGVYQNKGAYYCAACWDSNRKLVRVRETKGKSEGTTKAFVCDICNQWRFSDIPYEE